MKAESKASSANTARGKKLKKYIVTLPDDFHFYQLYVILEKHLSDVYMQLDPLEDFTTESLENLQMENESLLKIYQFSTIRSKNIKRNYPLQRRKRRS